jgi:hypothetical protein
MRGARADNFFVCSAGPTPKGAVVNRAEQSRTKEDRAVVRRMGSLVAGRRRGVGLPSALVCGNIAAAGDPPLLQSYGAPSDRTPGKGSGAPGVPPSLGGFRLHSEATADTMAGQGRFPLEVLADWQKALPCVRYAPRARIFFWQAVLDFEGVKLLV